MTKEKEEIINSMIVIADEKQLLLEEIYDEFPGIKRQETCPSSLFQSNYGQLIGMVKMMEVVNIDTRKYEKTLDKF